MLVLHSVARVISSARIQSSIDVAFFCCYSLRSLCVSSFVSDTKLLWDTSTELEMCALAIFRIMPKVSAAQKPLRERWLLRIFILARRPAIPRSVQQIITQSNWWHVNLFTVNTRLCDTWARRGCGVTTAWSENGAVNYDDIVFTDQSGYMSIKLVTLRSASPIDWSEMQGSGPRSSSHDFNLYEVATVPATRTGDVEGSRSRDNEKKLLSFLPAYRWVRTCPKSPGQGCLTRIPPGLVAVLTYRAIHAKAHDGDGDDLTKPRTQNL